MMEASHLTLATVDISTLIAVNVGWSLLALVGAFGLIIVIKMWPEATENMSEAARYVLWDRQEWAHALLLSITPAFLVWLIMTLSLGLRGLMPMASVGALILVGLLASAFAGFCVLMLAVSLEPEELPEDINS